MCSLDCSNRYRSGYEAAAKHFAPADLDVNLSGRSFMITGANSGIGKATAQEIANRGEFGYTTEKEHLFSLLQTKMTRAGQIVKVVGVTAVSLQEEPFTWSVGTRGGPKQPEMKLWNRVKIR